MKAFVRNHEIKKKDQKIQDKILQPKFQII